MRVLVGQQVDDPDPGLALLYEPPRLPWLRVNFVATVDGASGGHDGRSGSINNEPDHRVFGLLRSVADAVVVGAGTARNERYRPARLPVVVVSRRGAVPETLRGAQVGRVLMATTATAEHRDEARRLLGEENVLVAGEDTLDLAGVVARLHARGLRHLLCEGGPSLLGTLLHARLVDELDCTVVPRLVGGDVSRIVAGPPVDVPLRLHTLLEEDGTLLGRWLVDRD